MAIKTRSKTKSRNGRTWHNLASLRTKMTHLGTKTMHFESTRPGMTHFETKMTRLESMRTFMTHLDKFKDQNDALRKYEDRNDTPTHTSMRIGHVLNSVLIIFFFPFSFQT